MRAKEFITEDAILIEGLLDSLTKMAGSVINSQINTVTNAAQGSAVIAKVVSNPQFLETMTFLLKKYIKNVMKQIRAPKIIALIDQVFPKGRTLVDFVKALLLLPAVNVIKVSLGVAGDTVSDALQNYVIKSLPTLDQLAQTFIGQGLGALSSIMSVLKFSNNAFFDVLNMLNAKIKSAPVAPVATPGTPPSVNLSKPAIAESFEYRLNMRNYAALVE
jgi:hypothetical protein